MILTKTSTRTDKSSSSQKDAILFHDVWPILQSDWIAVYAAKGTTQCIALDQTLSARARGCGYARLGGECFIPEFIPPPADPSWDVGGEWFIPPPPADPSWDVGGGVVYS